MESEREGRRAAETEESATESKTDTEGGADPESREDASGASDGYSGDDEAKIEKRLEDLGYI